MQAQHTTGVPVYQMLVAALALAIVLTVGVGLTVSGKLDGLPVVGRGKSVEQAAPVFHRPSDRPGMRVEAAPVPVTVNRPTDRGLSRTGSTTIETNRPTDRP